MMVTLKVSNILLRTLVRGKNCENDPRPSGGGVYLLLAEAE